MGEKLTFQYDREADILYICRPSLCLDKCGRERQAKIRWSEGSCQALLGVESVPRLLSVYELKAELALQNVDSSEVKWLVQDTSHQQLAILNQADAPDRPRFVNDLLRYPLAKPKG